MKKTRIFVICAAETQADFNEGFIINLMIHYITNNQIINAEEAVRFSDSLVMSENCCCLCCFSGTGGLFRVQ